MEKEDWFVAKDISEALSISLSSDEELISLKQLFFLVEEDYSIEEKKAIHRFIKKTLLALEIKDEFLWFTYELCFFRIIWDKEIERNSNYEHSLKKWLCNNIARFFGAEFVLEKEEHPIGKLRADLLISKKGEQYIVECKTGKITPKHLEQIQNYLSLSGIDRGILVGQSCELILPKDIVFYAHKDLYKTEKN
ncbi:GxxExxY protein [Priestia megaterium]|nr:GxxExxY protein [Priestia megaterium]MDR4230434.1 GxxExxY protein [Priestia megaterium]MED4396298.1 GxxExxY protein [Priestia megaterium]MED4737131.1 GxxExxY protein [Priestia megaterium]